VLCVVFATSGEGILQGNRTCQPRKDVSQTIYEQCPVAECFFTGSADNDVDDTALAARRAIGRQSVISSGGQYRSQLCDQY